MTCRRSLVQFQYRPPLLDEYKIDGEVMFELSVNKSKKIEIEDDAMFRDVLGKLEPGIRNRTIAFRMDDKIYDVRERVPCDGGIEPVMINSDEGLDILRHSASHLMALAVQQLFDDVKFAIGPSIEDGFYYDFYLGRTFSPEDLKKIEKRMKKLAKSGDLEFSREEMSREEAMAFFRKNDQKFKVELLEDMDQEKVSLFRLGTFVDLCRGPHVPSVKMLKAFKLLSIAGAYWRGDENRETLQRIYGTAFPDRQELKNEMNRQEEARKRDHRKLGPQLELFDIREEAGGGLVFWYPRGYTLREIIENYWKEEHRKNGYDIILTPHIAKSDLWKTSGHYDFYRENMFVIEDEGQEFVLKPMNCPAHILVYKRKIHSYRDLPIRYAELGTVYRNERSGTLHGLLRVRGFTQDDAHIFCTPDQLMEEVDKCFDFAHRLLTSFGFDNYEVELSAHHPEYMDQYAGTEEEWIRAEEALFSAVSKRDIPYKKIPGEAVFYGPKIDLKLIDAIGRGWQATTIQFDFNLPRRFGVTYISSQGHKEYVYMIHRALLGSMERFIGTLTEHYAGEFPLWIAPVQVVMLPIGLGHHDYARECAARLKESGIRTEMDLREEKIGYKIRDAELHKIPYMAVVGDREMESGTMAVRSKKGGRLGSKKIEEFILKVVDEIEKKI